VPEDFWRELRETKLLPEDAPVPVLPQDPS
jgi:D-threo-aldose 1-dehydrogenase